MRFAHFTSATSIFIELCWSSALLFFFTENIDLPTFLHLCDLLSLTDLSADVLLSVYHRFILTRLNRTRKHSEGECLQYLHLILQFYILYLMKSKTDF